MRSETAPAPRRSAAPRPSAVRRGATALVTAGAGALAYGSVIERNAYTVRRVRVPVLPAGSAPLRVLHLSDLHITARQRRKQRWIAGLAALQADLIVNTGDTFSSRDALGPVLDALGPLATVPAVFVPGNNDYFVPKLKNPLRYFNPSHVPPANRERLPWPDLSAALVDAGWTDVTHVRTTVDAGGVHVALAGTDDPHLRRARYDLIAGPADRAAAVRIGVTHSPEPFVLRDFAADGYDLVLAGHTHGGQVRVPFGPAIVTNCDIDRGRARGLHRWDDGRMWFNVSAGLGTNPFTPLRFCCRPEATLLTLTGR